MTSSLTLWRTYWRCPLFPPTTMICRYCSSRYGWMHPARPGPNSLLWSINQISPLPGLAQPVGLWASISYSAPLLATSSCKIRCSHSRLPAARLSSSLVDEACHLCFSLLSSADCLLISSSSALVSFLPDHRIHCPSIHVSFSAWAEVVIFEINRKLQIGPRNAPTNHTRVMRNLNAATQSS